MSFCTRVGQAWCLLGGGGGEQTQHLSGMHCIYDVCMQHVTILHVLVIIVKKTKTKWAELKGWYGQPTSSSSGDGYDRAQ